MRLDKCDVYTTKETLGYRGRKPYISPVRGAAETEENQREKQIHKLKTKAFQGGGERNLWKSRIE